MSDRVGEQLGNYRLLRLLGAGTFAEVYLGEHLYLQKQAAIKVLPEELTGGEAEQFRAEARTIARLAHPHIVHLLEYGVQGETAYLVMEYAPGGTLRQRHQRGTRLAPGDLLPYLHQVALALQYAHDQQVIHRDVKPENLLVGSSGAVLLSDFGIAVPAHRSQSEQLEAVAGTVTYMAPEQVEGHPRPASDQYALGVVLYEWLTGYPPFTGAFAEVVTQHLLVAPPPLRIQVPTLSPAIEAVVLQALAKDPRQRFQSVAALATAFEQASKIAPTAVSPSSPTTPARGLAAPAEPIPVAVGPTLSPVPDRGLPITKQHRMRGLLVGFLMLVVISSGLVGLGVFGKGSHALGSTPQRAKPTATTIPTAPTAPTATPKPTLGTIHEFAIPISGSTRPTPFGITTGPDGNLWFTDTGTYYTGGKIGRITPEGTITEFPLPDPNSIPKAITVGPDSNLWFTECAPPSSTPSTSLCINDRIGRITLGGTITEFALPTPDSYPYGITAGPDGNLWFTESYGNRIGRITPGGTITEFALPSPANNGGPGSIIAGPDGNLWFTEGGEVWSGSVLCCSRIGRITPAGVITEFPLSISSFYADITAGPDGNLWFTQYYPSNLIGRITPRGSITEFSLPTSCGLDFWDCGPWGITTGPDGNLWFTENGFAQQNGEIIGGNRIGRITLQGSITEFALPMPPRDPSFITTGPDGNLWFTEPGRYGIGWINPGP